MEDIALRHFLTAASQAVESDAITGLFTWTSIEKNVPNVIHAFQKIPLHILQMIIIADLLNMLQFYGCMCQKRICVVCSQVRVPRSRSRLFGFVLLYILLSISLKFSWNWLIYKWLDSKWHKIKMSWGYGVCILWILVAFRFRHRSERFDLKIDFCMAKSHWLCGVLIGVTKIDFCSSALQLVALSRDFVAAVMSCTAMMRARLPSIFLLFWFLL